jgi:predicted  nucleic acid-binding Zn-ribbon protein
VPRIEVLRLLEGIEHLLEMQRLDSEIQRRQEVLAALPAKRKQLEESSTAAAAALVAAREALQAAEIQQRQAESALQDQEALLQKLEGQQFQVKDNTAYTALLSEMEHTKTQISACETSILEGMDAVEAARTATENAETLDREASDRKEAEVREIEARAERLEAELAQLNAERDAVGPMLDVAILAAYEKIAKRKRPALALVKHDTCEGCRVGIPAQNYIEILKGEELVTCGNCQRILLVPEMISGSPKTAAS